MQKNVFFIAILMIVASCHKADVEPANVEPPKKDFTVGYFFVNKGDGNIQNLNLQTRTFYPNVGGRAGYNSLQIFDKYYSPIGARDSIAHLFTEPHMVKTLYPGCITYMKVFIFFKTPVYVRYPSPNNPPQGGYRMRVFELPPDTVTAAANCTRSFHWPADTLRYKELPWYN